VDGDEGEWDVSYQGIPMYEAGDAEKPNAIQFSNVWIDYDCENSKLCILVKREDDHFIEDTNPEVWVKSWDNEVRITEDAQAFILDEDDNRIGVEACYSVTNRGGETCLSSLEVHVNMDEESNVGLTSSTGRKQGDSGRIALDITCPSIEGRTRSVFKERLLRNDISSGRTVMEYASNSVFTRYSTFVIGCVLLLSYHLYIN
jgi:hypothetical protein